MTWSQPTLLFRKSPRLPMILQDERAECGHACVAMISQYWGHQLDLYTLRRIRQTNHFGITLLEMRDLFERLGFITRALKVPFDELSLIQCPAILHWNMNHFVVLKQVTKRGLVIHDPASGVRHCHFDEASHSFTGVVLEVSPSDDFDVIRAEKKLTLGQLLKTIRGVYRFAVLLLLLSLGIEMLQVLNPLFLQYVTDDVIGYRDAHNLWVIAAGFLCVILIQVFAEYLRGSMVIYVTNSLTEQFSSNVVLHLLKLPLSFFEKRHKGDLQSKFQSIDHIQKKMTTDFVSTVLDGLMILINALVMWIYSPLLTWIVMSAILIGFGVRYASYHLLHQETETSIHQHAKATSIFLETLQGIIPIKSFLRERMRFDVWRNSYLKALNADIQVSKIHVFYQVIQQGICYIEHVIVVCVGATLVMSGHFSIGMLLAFLSYRLLLVNKTMSFMQHVFDYRLLSISLDRLSDILFQPPEHLTEGLGHSFPISGALVLDAIDFRYHADDKLILNQISLSIQAGEKVAIIGRSGGGKSTLLKVMMGLLQPTDGSIYIDGLSIQTLGLKAYRETTASVMQDDALLSGSILRNISFFDEAVDVARVYQVAEWAAIHDDICQLPMGYETLVGDMGSLLSGGQKQRILLARALYKNPKILFLDEASSHLDGVNEKKINHALKALNMTQIVIAHRQETIQMADRVIDLDKINSR